MYCFACDSKPGRPASELWIATRSASEQYVSNIVSNDVRKLTCDQYNDILQEFQQRFAQPAADSVGVDVRPGNPDPQIEDFLSPTAARLLRSFSALANKSILHPRDRKRWNEFLAAAYRENAQLDSSMLQRWLIEDENWPGETAIELSVEYENARALLETFESQHA